MNRARSFKLTTSKEAVLGQLVLNYEHLMRKMRNQNLGCSRIYISLRDHERKSTTGNRVLLRHTRDPKSIMESIQSLFNTLWKSGEGYRYVSLTFSGLRVQSTVQMNLFESPEQESSQETIYGMLDQLDAKFGKTVVSLGSTLTLPKKLGSHLDPKRYPLTLQHPLLPGESLHRRVRYPFLGSI
tara:strand:- start:73 stop:624 length:552 start_codon:yes stop_codon:yes gene_type:complete